MKKDRIVFAMVGFCIALIIALITSVTLVLTGVLKNSDDAKADIKIIAGSASKEYDGTPLTCDEWTYEGTLKPGHFIVCETNGSQTNIGASGNYIKNVLITDSYGNDHNKEYSYVLVSGTLIVYEKLDTSGGSGSGSGEQSEGGNGGSLPDDQADISGGDSGGSGEQTDASSYDVLRLYSPDYTGNVYLRYKSYGNYNGMGFDQATPYDYGGTEGLFNPTAKWIYGRNYELSVNVLGETGQYYLPYYATTELPLTDDVKVYLTDSEYTVSFKYYNYLTYSSLSSVNPDLYEYNQFVHNNYLTINSSLGYNLRSLSYNLNYFYSGKSLIAAIVNYVKSSAEYSADGCDYGSATDIVYYFLTQGTKGKCTDFAAAATMLFRAYGIPARYTTGFIAKVVAGKFIYVTGSDAHAWVEIYLDNIGWVQLEVTGGSNQNAEDRFDPDEHGEERDIFPPDEELPEEGMINEDQSDITENGEGLDGQDISGQGGTDDPVTVMTVDSNYTGDIYLRFKSYNSYNGKGFDNYLYYDLSGKTGVFNNAVKCIGGDVYYADISLESAGQYYLPYYASNNYELKDDVKIYVNEINYRVNFKSFYYEHDEFSGYFSDGAYNTFVKKHYLTINDNLKNSLIGLTGFTGTNDSLIRQIINYVRGRAAYSVGGCNYGTATDIVYYFLTQATEGKCTDFAAAATMLFRAYGIPSRYTIGYLAHSVEGQLTVVTNLDAHAWVEIYLEDIGWAHIEVTPGKYEPPVPAVERILKIESPERNVEYTGGDIYVDPYDVTFTVNVAGDYVVKITDTLPSVREVGDSIKNRTGYIIYNADGEDVTELYLTVDDSECYNLTVVARKITVSTNTDQKPYDGTPLDGVCQLVSGTLIDGHTLVASSITDPDSIDNVVKVIDNLTGDDVSNRYAITYQTLGQLTVGKIMLYVFSDYECKYYDGTTLTGTTHNIIEFYGTILTTHTLSVTAASIPYPYVGRYLNVPEIVITDGNNVDVTEKYYTINTDNCNDLEIKPLVINVVASNEQYQYDGMPHTVNASDLIIDYNGTATPSGAHYIIIDVSALTDKFYIDELTYPSVLNVGDVELNRPEFVVKNLDGDVIDTACYVVDDGNCGNIEIVGRELLVVTNSYEKTYDGSVYTGVVEQVVSGLIEGHTLTATSVTEPGTYLNLITAITAVDPVTGEIIDVTDQYIVSYQGGPGELKVNKIRLTLTSGDQQWNYDGTYHYGDYVFNDLEKAKILSSHTLESETPASIIDVGEKPNKPTIVITVNGEDVTDKYYDLETDSDYGTLEIIPLTLTIKSNDVTKIYDGQPLTISPEDVISDGTGALEPTGSQVIIDVSGLVGVTVEVVFYPSITDPGITPNCPEIILRNAENEIINANNYSVQLATGYLTVEKIKLKVTSNSASKTYDGTPLTGDGYTVTLVEEEGNDYIDGHVIQLVAKSITDPKESCKNVPDIKILVGGVDVTEDYIKYYQIADSEGCGRLTVNRRTIILSSGSDSKPYDGTPLYGGGYVLGGDGILETLHYIGNIYSASITDVGEIDNIPALEVRWLSDGSLVEFDDYYEIINGDVGTLTVYKPKTILYASSTGDVHVIYGETLNLDPDEVSFTGLKDGHYIGYREYKVMSKVGSYAKCPLVVINDGNGNNVSDQYDINVENCATIYVDVRPVIFETATLVKNGYDGEPLTNGNNPISVAAASPYDLIDGDHVNCTFTGSQTLPGTSLNTVTNIRIYNALNEDVTDNYSVTVNYGELIVNP